MIAMFHIYSSTYQFSYAAYFFIILTDKIYFFIIVKHMNSSLIPFIFIFIIFILLF